MNSFRINKGRVEVWRDLEELSERASELFIGIAREATTSRGAFRLALSGGSTPQALYNLLAQKDKAARVAWEQAHVYWSDERCVPPDDSQSNYRLAQDALLRHVPVPPEQVHRMRGEDEPESAALDYAAELEQEFGESTPRFSLILLGMGEDGHTASLFPHSPVLQDTERTVAASYVEQLAAHRLTLTLRTLNAAEMIIFLVAGEAKAATLLKALDESKAVEDGSLPARLVRPAEGELLWLVDEAAASLITSLY
jgi:6-phosphogluconolactonase